MLSFPIFLTNDVTAMKLKIKVFATCLPTLLHTENLKRQGEGNFHLVCLHDIGFTNLSKYFGSLNQYDGPMHA